ncbi:hypothetical protein MYCTH_2307970 [Thermothelomyces thermophilus ATCC 42464]|uniref:Structure-specific endonuclease subunit SLX4 n=1 Tax=Thermothelomyces thermophilus (strain ATCC 42464 / BCRC 31852 / DSM 1799) TaxID=573729 RepID=G2QIT5_THET4|nr:uncharacterized protein MYCTH_2307970 [Thermothelomyces thermophilus ATCC 42464]AEO59563.1 hypothetical protein MYCTH_2307970 [Thermothelomyces thermophilus ATCC 42464]
MAHEDSVVIISSSPDFPSICDLLPKATKKPPLRSGSNAALTPYDAPVTFTSAASQLKSSHASQSERTSPRKTQVVSGVTVTKSHARNPPTERPPEPNAQGTNLESKEANEKLNETGIVTKGRRSARPGSREVAAEPRTIVSVDEVHPQPGGGLSPVQGSAEAENTLPKSRVRTTVKERRPKKRTETVSRHFAPQGSAPKPLPELIADPIEDESVMLEPAMRRKRDWTPPRESVRSYCSADSSTTKEPQSSQDNIFETLQETYGFVADPATHVKVTLPLPDTEVLGKRKIIEMASIGNKQKSPDASPTKPKAPKKRPRTITDLATAAYRPSEKQSVPSAETRTGSLFTYLESPKEQATIAPKDASAKPKASRGTKAKAGKRKEQPPKPILLSPTSAMRQVANQDFVFGTASQLATEDDPVLLRALHEAMQVSNQADSGSDLSPSPKPVNSKLAGRKRPGAGLWAAGARYDDGDLGVDVLDLTRSSPLLLDKSAPEDLYANHEPALSVLSHKKAGMEVELPDDSFALSSSPPVGRHNSSPPSASRNIRQAVVQRDQGSSSLNNHPQITPEESDLGPPPSNQEQYDELLLSQSNSSRQEEPVRPPAPNYEMYSDARLAKEVASYGFKAVKKRTAMIAILKQCWESQNKTTFGSRATFAAMSTSSTNGSGSSPKPRDRAGRSTTGPRSGLEGPAPSTRRGKKSVTAGAAAETEAPQPMKRPRGRPRKSSTASSVSNTTEARAFSPANSGRDIPASVRDTESEGARVEKRAQGQTGIDNGAISSNQAPGVRTATSPKNARCSPKRNNPAPSTPGGKSSSKQVLEIPDSDSDDPFGSTPGSSPERWADAFSPPPAMDLSVTEDTETSLIASPTSHQVSLFRYITKAIVNAPRATNPEEPSWYEKMLMYDPIILEDLTAWLNSGQLDKVGYDGEVSPGDVKKWCESKSVCCLWRVNLRGQERKRF